jgi:hypothetical protein
MSIIAKPKDQAHNDLELFMFHVSSDQYKIAYLWSVIGAELDIEFCA